MGTRVETPSRTIGGSRGRAGTAKGQTGESEEVLEWASRRQRGSRQAQATTRGGARMPSFFATNEAKWTNAR